MDKYIDYKCKCEEIPEYDSVSYAKKQLAGLKTDLLSLAKQIEDDVCGIDKVICGLNGNHKWKLTSYESHTYPLRRLPGVYRFNCTDCGETIIVPASIINQTEFVKLLGEENE